MKLNLNLPTFGFFILFFCFQFSLLGQHSCGNTFMRDQRMQTDPSYGVRLDEWNQMMYSIQSGSISSAPVQKATYTIPVVVHVVHNNGTANIPNSQVISAIQHLNEAFSNTGSYQTSNGVDVTIQFCLANQDTNGVYTTGITNTQSTLTDLTAETDDVDLKNLIRWNQEHYLNIWVVSEITSVTHGSGVNGYAFLPTSHGYPEDGVVIEAASFGSSSNASKVLVHELGHYLGLYHTFEGNCGNNDCLADGDRVCDTPPDASNAAVNCQVSINTCTTDADDLSTNNPFRPVANGGLGDQPDMINNYLDYGYSGCKDAFTEGQKNRMIDALVNTRISLLNSEGCDAICNTPIVAGFSTSQANVFVGTTVNFTNTSTGAQSYSWLINNQQFSTLTNASNTFTTPGTYIVELICSNGEPVCTESFKDTVEVSCTATPSFDIANPNPLYLVGDLIDFTNTSSGAISYEWLVDGVSTSNSTDLSHSFSSKGGYQVCLVANAAGCSDTICQSVKIGICEDKRWNNWIMGENAHIDFNGSTPTSQNGSSLNTFEGSSSISDSDGNLLCYSDGVTVWNKLHGVMPGGSGFNGSPTTSQSAMLLNQPKNDSQIYLFTLGEDQATTGLRYHIIDMSLSGGLGEVVLSNQQLVNPATESMTAIQHCNGIDYWIISHGRTSNKFYAYLLTDSGLNTTPVISLSGLSQSGLDNGLGIMKGSPYGDKLAVSINYLHKLQLFDFDNSTGIVSNASNISMQRAYGVEFSADGSKLYATSGPITIGGTSSLYQFDMQAGTNLAILATQNSVMTTSDWLAALQLAPDGNIYIGEWTSAWTGVSDINAITNPNAFSPACNYVSDYLSLNSGLVWFGLPFAPNSIPSDATITIDGPTVVCASSQELYEFASTSCGEDSVVWSVSGPSTIVSQLNSTVELSFVNNSTPYSVSLTAENFRPCGTVYDTLEIIVNPSPEVNIGPDTTVCSPVPTTYVLDAGPGFTSYSWNNGLSNAQSFPISSTGTNWVEVINQYGCISHDTAEVYISNPNAISVDLGPDVTICNGTSAILDAGPGAYDYEWQGLPGGQTYTAYSAGTYIVMLTTDIQCGFQSSDTIEIFHTPTPFDFGNDTILCEGYTITLDPGAGYLSYNWQDQSMNQTFVATGTGTYSVQVTDASGCFYEDELYVDFQDCAGIDDFIAEFGLMIYPNPSRGMLKVSSNVKMDNIFVTDIAGRFVQVPINSISDDLAEVNFSHSAKGIYTIHIEVGTVVVNRKVVIE